MFFQGLIYSNLCCSQTHQNLSQSWDLFIYFLSFSGLVWALRTYAVWAIPVQGCSKFSLADLQKLLLFQWEPSSKDQGRADPTIEATMTFAETILTPRPPVAKKVSHVFELHGDKREDNYYWIRDDERKNPDVLAYLKEENNYTEEVMAGELTLAWLTQFMKCMVNP